MDCMVPTHSALWTGAQSLGLPTFQQRNYISNFYFSQKRPFGSSFYPGMGLLFPNDDVDYPTDKMGDMTMPYPGMMDPLGELKLCVVCGERASGFYFGALVCLPCKSFYIRCTKDGEPTFTCQCSGNCDIVKQGRIRCQYCRYQRCLMAGMCRKEKPETVQPAEGQVLCKVCGDIANGIHFGVNTCEGCKKFFRRGLVENQSYICKGDKDCGINPRNRNNCRYCRYQKCIGVGMSREAIKMGRPKKADGCEMTTLTGSPKMGNQSPVEVDNTKTTTPQIGDEPAKDSLKISSVCNEIKKENPDTCEYEKKVMWCEGQNQGQGQMTSWQPSNQGQSCRGQTHSSDFIEEDMDDILMMLQNDNQSGAGPAKKIRCYGNGYNDLPVTSQHVCKAEMGLQQDQWQFGMNKSMSVSQTQLNLNRPPPPQYPGYSSSFPPSQISSAMRASPCQSPPRQMPSPGGYMSDSTTAGSPGYVPNGSPMHSPACQFSPNHSPMYNSPSPHSPYDTSSSQGSPYSETMYSQHPFSPDNNYHVTDLSVNVNCGPQPNMASIGSPTRQFSPAYNNGHITGQSMPSQPMTIPHQEGGIINSQESWYMTGTPSNICHSPSHTNNNNSFPNQESSFRRLENISRINHHFLSGSSCDLHLNQDKDCDGMMSRSDVETEIVNKTLSSMSQGDSYYYVLSDSHSCSNDSGCGSGNFDEFTSCRRMYKRKILVNSEFCDSPQSGNGSVGRFKRHQSEKYWRASVEVEDAFPMTSDKQMLLEHLNKVFQQMTDRCAENRNVQQQDTGSCQQARLRIIRNTTAGVKFAAQIPGFSVLHPEDKAFLCRNVTFMSTLLMAGHKLYGPEETNFQHFWSWNVSARNPFYPFRQQLMEVGKKVHAANMDVYEVAVLAALLFMASDFSDLAYPEAIEEGRRKLIAALKSYELTKVLNVKSRLSELFALVPEIRHLGMWHQELMKQTRINVQIQEVNQIFDTVHFRES